MNQVQMMTIKFTENNLLKIISIYINRMKLNNIIRKICYILLI